MESTRVFHYVICLDFKFKKLFIIWISDDVDGVVVDNDNKVITFRSKEKLFEYAKTLQLEITKNITEYNIFNIQQWLSNPKVNIDFEEFLNFWNLCTDISHSVNIEFFGDAKDELTNSIYKKIYDGSGIFNLEDPNPVISEIELPAIERIIQNGIDLLVRHLIIKD